ncbi:MAG TPA: hypothetical protein VMX18_03305 [Candidatus Bipolaricaulota bacterium]|nr:hypothetical protein [Candidatus Bipolaricaulota bacterium]
MQISDQSSGKNSKVLLCVLIIALSLLIITNGITVYFLLIKKGAFESVSETQKLAALEQKGVATSEIETTDGQSANSTADEITTDGLTTSEQVDVQWYDIAKLKDVGASGFFGDNYNAVIASFSKNKDIISSYGKEYAKDSIDNSEYYKIGKIASGVYKDKELYLIIPMQEMGPTGFLRVIKNGDQYVVLSKHSAEIYGIYTSVYSVNETISIRNLETPGKIGIPNSSINLIKAAGEKFLLFQNLEEKDLTKLFEFARGEFIYKYDMGKMGTEICYYAVAKDGTVREYEFDILGGETLGVLSTQLPIAWSSGAYNKYEFFKGTIGGCGVGRCYHYAAGATEKDLVKSGVLSGKYDIYELKDGALLTDGVSYIRQIYDDYYPGYDEVNKTQLDKTPYETFTKEHPAIFWKDPFGGFVEFRNLMFIPAVECGKPVIYLYPEKQMDVSVKVDPNGGFSITEPDYNGGWQVNATPEGKLFNYADKTYYPYLFWEGKGMFYQRPNQGFVVAKNDVEKFLWEKLALLGLNENESDEFIEFWLPRMQDKNYYFVTFVPQSQFDKLAPLTVSPRPDTVIRVFMDYEGLDYPVKVEAQKIVTPERRGFTVVEWGGALHK